MEKFDHTSSLIELFMRWKPLRKDFLGRALLCSSRVLLNRGQLTAASLSDSMIVASPVGPLGTENFMKAIATLMRALDSALPDRCGYLVYNISVVFWRAAQSFMTQGRWQQLLPAIARISAALTSLNEPDVVWRAQVTLAYVKALQASGRDAEATEALEILYKSVKDFNSETLEKIATLQLTLGVSPELIKKLKRGLPAAGNASIAAALAMLEEAQNLVIKLSNSERKQLLQDAKILLMSQKAAADNAVLYYKKSTSSAAPSSSGDASVYFRHSLLSALVSVGRVALAMGDVSEARSMATEVMRAGDCEAAAVRAEFLLVCAIIYYPFELKG